MEDLEINPLYRAFLTTYRREFDLACKMSYLVAIPHSDSLDQIKIDQTLINSHILVPSKLLKMHYAPLHVGPISVDIELDGKKLIVNYEKRREHNNDRTTKSRLIVKILGEEIGYNSRSKEYRTILIDQPMLLQANSRSSSNRIARRFNSSPKSSILGQRLGPKKPLRDQEDCSRYLESISQEITVNLEGEIRLMQSNYIILSKFLDDASERIKSVCEAYIPRYEQKLAQSINNGSKQSQEQKLSFTGPIGQAIRISVENYVMYLLHGKIIACIHAQYENQDNKMLKNFDTIQRSAPDITTLGAQSVFSDFHISDELANEIRGLPNKQSPLAIISSLTRSIELINESLNQNVKFKHQIGFGDTANDDTSHYSDNELVTICSDDLIASLVYCFANVKPPKLYSISHYLSTFGWTSSSRDHAAYYAATFHLVVQYIYGYTTQNRNQPPNNFRQPGDRLHSSQPVLRPIISAKPRRVESVKSLDSFIHKRSPSRLSLATHFSLLDASTDTQNSSRDEQIIIDCGSMTSSSNSSITKSGWTFL